MAYQYLQALPQIANGQASKIWIIPAELNKALEGIGNAFGGLLPPAAGPKKPITPKAKEDPIEAVKQAEAEIKRIESEAQAVIDEKK
jgi:regulator of protease activity HflC (stomatin/prohibitin superfamily)